MMMDSFYSKSSLPVIQSRFHWILKKMSLSMYGNESSYKNRK